MDKKALRSLYKKHRSALTPDQIQSLSLAIANQCLRLNIWDKTFYHLFLTIEEKQEVNTQYLMQILMGRDKEIIISSCDFDSMQMQSYLLTEETKIKKNNFNIPEPISGPRFEDTKIEVVFIPLLAYDEKGNRIGYGKGFYDRFLARCNPDTIKVGLSFFPPESEIEGVSDNDVKLDYCVTPEQIYRF